MYNSLPRHSDSDRLSNFREGLLELLRKRAGCAEVQLDLIGKISFLGYTIDGGGVFMEPVKTELMQNPDRNQKEGGHAEG